MTFSELRTILDQLYPGEFAQHLLPLRRGSKVPIEKGWTKKSPRPDRNAHLDFIAEHARAGGNIGWAVPKGVIVLDADDLVAVDWLATQLKQAPTQATARGAHFVALLPSDSVLSNTCGIETPGGGVVDVRAFGSQIVVEPSHHPDAGVPYRWRRTLVDGVLSVLPEAILALLPTKVGASTTRSSKIPVGARHTRLVRGAARLRAGGAGEREIRESLKRENANDCEEPIDSAEAENIIQWASSLPIGDDLSLAVRFAEAVERKAIYCPAIGWYLWDGIRWREDDTEAILVRACEAAQGWVADRTIARPMVMGRVRAVVTLAQTLLREDYERLDSDPWLLGTPTGTIDLRDQVRRDPRPSDLITKATTFDFDPSMSAPRWDSFLEEVLPDPEMRAYLARICGYTLTGLTNEQVFFLLTGSGANGKSTFLDAFLYVLGDYAATARFETFMVKRGGDPIAADLERLKGARLVASIEGEESGRLAESTIKQITGGDRVLARKYYAKRFVTFIPTFKLFLVANHRPEILGSDHAIWRRVQIVPFDVRINRNRIDKSLGEALREEAGGIFAWAMKGLSDYQKQGLCPPLSARTVVEEYRDESDMIARFVEERCELRRDYEVQASAIQRDFTSWARYLGIDISWSKVPSRLAEKYMVRKRRIDGRYIYKGIRLKSEERG